MGEETLPLAERLKRESHRICCMIFSDDMAWIDIAIQISQMRELCLAEEPEKAELFEAVYVSRFSRLWHQWREAKTRDELNWEPESHALPWDEGYQEGRDEEGDFAV